MFNQYAKTTLRTSDRPQKQHSFTFWDDDTSFAASSSTIQMPHKKSASLPAKINITQRKNKAYQTKKKEPLTFLQYIYFYFIPTSWRERNIKLAMSKISFILMLFGLGCISILFFFTGFLVAVNVYGIGAPPSNSQSTDVLRHQPTQDSLIYGTGHPNLIQANNQNPTSPKTHFAGMQLSNQGRVPSSHVQAPPVAIPQMPQPGSVYVTQNTPQNYSTPQSYPNSGYVNNQHHQQSSYIQKPMTYPMPANNLNHN